jgi:TatD DNase family protein
LEEEKSPDLFGILFSGTYEQALKAISYNMKLGNRWSGYFQKWKDQFLSQIDLKHIVLETDSPYLAPVPFRGNESSYLVNIG